MRKILLTILVLIGLTFAQTIKVVETQVIAQKNNQTEYAFPQFSPDGDKVLFTSTGYKGLWVYDKNTNVTVQLNDLRGAGYKPVFSKDGEKVFFRHDEYVKRRKLSTISSQSLNTRQMSHLVEKERDLSTPKTIANNIVAYKENDQQINMKIDDQNQVCLLEKPVSEGINAFTDNSNLYLEKNGRKTVFNPIGEGRYIWGSLSPNQDKVVFKVMGKGCFVCDLNGDIELELGPQANYPNWSEDGKWIVYMSDKDDGHKVISSDIIAVHLATKKSVTLTKTNDKIEMYPDWSPVNDEILYHTTNGSIELLKLEIQE